MDDLIHEENAQSHTSARGCTHIGTSQRPFSGWKERENDATTPQKNGSRQAGIVPSTGH